MYCNALYGIVIFCIVLYCNVLYCNVFLNVCGLTSNSDLRVCSRTHLKSVPRFDLEEDVAVSCVSSNEQFAPCWYECIN